MNRWGCRLRYPRPGDSSDPFKVNLASWWQQHAGALPPTRRTLAKLTDAEIAVLASAYDDLHQRVVSVPEANYRRRIGPTAAAKLLYFLRPETVTAWDRRISRHFGDGSNEAGFAAHLTRCRTWAYQITTDATAAGATEPRIGAAVCRPHSSVAKLIDEYLYQVITRGKRF